MHEYMIFRRLIKKKPWALHFHYVFYVFILLSITLLFKANFVKKLNRRKGKIYPKNISKNISANGNGNIILLVYREQ